MDLVTTDREQFTTWLKEQEPTAHVGEARLCWACPLATYLQATGWPGAEVSNSYITDDCDNTIGTPEPWARAFITAVDRFPHAFSITASEALEILATIPNE